MECAYKSQGFIQERGTGNSPPPPPPLEIENDDTDVIITSTATIGYAITKYNIIIRLSVLYLNLMFLVLKYVQNFMKIYKTL